MKKIMALMFLFVFLTMPVYAETGSSGKVLSYIEFSSLRENHGMPKRVIDRGYEEYRNGRFAVTTLNSEQAR